MLKEYKRLSDGNNKETRKQLKKEYQSGISALLQPLKDAKIPVIVIVEGWDSSGKGTLIKNLISEIDPRFYNVYVNESIYDDRTRYPFMYPYYKAIPENGKILFMDSAYIQSVIDDDLTGVIDSKTKKERINSINIFERQMRNDGYLIVKFFINVSKSTQKESQKSLMADKNNEWRVTKLDSFQNNNYEKYQEAYDEILEATNNITWHILDGNDKKTLAYDAFKILYSEINAATTLGKYNGLPYHETFEMSNPIPKLEDADLSAKIPEKDYRNELKELQKSIEKLHRKIYRKKIPMVICYEGWDAAGKGGNIRRLAKPLDPRGYDTHPIASPEPSEKNRQFLWRFWKRLPKSGHIAIFDRTWYGRVMVERIEGFCTENDWKRAYNEINEFEKELCDNGTVVLKFWIQIDSDTQLARFTDRQNTPEKQWKITDEDWRNRERWDDYQEAITEMIDKTSTSFAPWHIIESVDKYYARIKVLRIVEAAMKKALERK